MLFASTPPERASDLLVRLGFCRAMCANAKRIVERSPRKGSRGTPEDQVALTYAWGNICVIMRYHPFENIPQGNLPKTPTNLV